jgi:hypothetical protein
MAALKTNYKDDVFSGNRKYTMINNSDGTVSFVDATVYSQKGDTYGSNDINTQNQAINEKGIVVSNTVIPVASRITGNQYFFYS